MTNSSVTRRREQTNWRWATITKKTIVKKKIRIRWHKMSKARATIGTDGIALPILPPERDERVWAKLVRVMFYTPGFIALLLIKTGEPAGFGITVELLMLASAAAIVGGLYIGTQSSGAGADASSQIATWSGSLVIELLSAVPF